MNAWNKGRYTPAIDRILKKVIKNTVSGCWVFIGSNLRGYGSITLNHKSIIVHRYIYWYHKIRFTGMSWDTFVKTNRNLLICHTCDNPPCLLELKRIICKIVKIKIDYSLIKAKTTEIKN
jgi:hypothetical protein